MTASGEWYVRTADGSEYGPADRDRLVKWAREGRIDASSLISTDRESWTPASFDPELELKWLIEIEPGQYSGPYHKDVLSEFFERKLVLPSVRVFCLEDGSRCDKSEIEKLQRELAASAARVSELESAVADSNAALAAAQRKFAERETLLEADAERLNGELTASRKMAESEKERADRLQELLEKPSQKSRSSGFFSKVFGEPPKPDFSWLEQAARRELAAAAAARARTASSGPVGPHGVDFIDVTAP